MPPSISPISSAVLVQVYDQCQFETAIDLVAPSQVSDHATPSKQILHKVAICRTKAHRLRKSKSHDLTLTCLLPCRELSWAYKI